MKNIFNQDATERALELAKYSPTSISRRHRGILAHHTPGRTDALPISVESGSFVIPADVVSGLAEGNTLGGAALLDKMFGKTSKNRTVGRGKKIRRAAGGRVPEVEIVAAGGEYVVSPEIVRMIGEGDLEKGHDRLDEFVLDVRRKTINDMMNLPRPER